MESIGEVPSNVLTFNPNTLHDVRKLYNLDQPGRMDVAINILEEWIKKQDHFMKKDFSRIFLERVIIFNKGQLERAKRNFDIDCTKRTSISQFFGVHNVREYKELHPVINIPLPKLTPDNHRILLTHFNGPVEGISAPTWHTFFKKVIVSAEFERRFEYCDGYINIINGLRANYMEIITSVNLSENREILHLVQKGFGMRAKEVHVITTAVLTNGLVAFMKQLLSVKLRSRLHFHKTLDALYDYVPRDILPEEYGGKEKSIKELNENWLNELSSEDHLEYLKTLEDMKTDESRRSTIKFNEQYLGMPGTFRNLNVD